jgi:peptide/nickel transport system permease protein
MTDTSKFRALLVLLAALHLVLLLPGFFATYDPAEQDRELSFAPPTSIHFVARDGSWRFHPFIYRQALDDSGVYHEQAGQEYPLRFLVHGASYRLLGVIPANFHLIGVDTGARLSLMGTDRFGRDQFSRLLYGGQITLFAGLLAAALALALGTIGGAISGLYGGWVDDSLMRFGEIFLALPWLYLLFAVRAFLPLSVPASATFFLVVIIIGLVGWVRPARLVRGVVLSVKERNYVRAAHGFGGSSLYVLRRHIAPETYPVLLTQATLLVPQFILAEVTLSLLGLGIAEPVPSWGNMLASALEYRVMVSCTWMFLPGLALAIMFMTYFGFTEALQKRVQSSPQ